MNVNILGKDDPRFQSIASHPQYSLVAADEAFHEIAQIMHSIPSNLYYDAKLWRFLEKDGQDGDFCWNVAR